MDPYAWRMPAFSELGEAELERSLRRFEIRPSTIIRTRKTMDWPTERHTHGIQSASLVFVCALVVGVVAVGLLALTTPAPSATETALDDQVYGSGPFSTFPQGNETTSIDLEDPQLANSSLSQIYYKIVDSSAFRAYANGSSWVTVGWSDFQLMNGTVYHVVAGSFVFVSGGRMDGSAQADYFLESGRVTSVFGPLQYSCVG
jgi:hypothetical protein